ncbi:MAG TPA: hypothetical protein VM266_00370 [Solirubrobacteraceae bacterium]|nr:hypothetical protein [Solirubrobacteraceae bacterium]
MRIALVLVVLAALAAALVPIASGGAASAPQRAGTAAKRVDLRKSPDLWATINVCDTETHPNVIGIRGSMPGIGRRARMWMRFQVQFRSHADGKWHNLPGSADSGWKKVGVTRNRVIESGHNFTFLPPEGGGVHTLRGAVTFKWVRRGRIVRKLREITEGGHRSTAGADPAGFSAAICQIS